MVLSSTNYSENSELTVEVSRAINPEITPQMSRNFEERNLDLNSNTLDAINLAIAETCCQTSKMH